MKKRPNRIIKRGERRTESIIDIIDRDLSQGQGRPGRPTPDKEKLGGIRDDLVWLLSVAWPDIGWQLPKAKTPEELREALAPLKGHSSENLIIRFLRPTLVNATTREIRLARKAFGEAVERCRDAQTNHDICHQAAGVAESAMNRAEPERPKVLQSALLKGWGENSKARKELEAAQAALKTLGDQLMDKEAGFAQMELLDFIGKKKYARDPLGLANAMAGLPTMIWQVSHERCSKIEYAQWPTFPFRVFKEIESIWKRRDNYPALSRAQLFRQEVEKMPKTVMAVNPDTGKKFKQQNHLRSHFADNARHLRLAIEEVEAQPATHPQRIPFLIAASLGKNLAKPQTAQDSVLNEQEKIR